MSSTAFSIDFDLDALHADLEEVDRDFRAAARPAAQAGAQVLYDAASALAPRAKSGHWFTGSSYQKAGTAYWFDAGNLKNSIYQAYSTKESNDSVAVYNVAWNPRKAPYGYMVEYGHLQRYTVWFDEARKKFVTDKKRPLATPIHVAARPFLRPAFDRAGEALQAMEETYIKALGNSGAIQ